MGTALVLSKASVIWLFVGCLWGMAWLAAAAAGEADKPALLVSLDGPWTLAPDPQNVGREQHWWENPVPGAKPTPVPWIIQEVFPGCHGVVWYWRDFAAPANPHPQGRYLLRFWTVDYLADVWVNGVHVGQHEGGEDPFVLDVTDAVKPQAANRIAVRVLNPTNGPIDGIALGQTPHRNKTYPYTPGCDYNYGGITDSVELLATAPVRVEDLFVRPDPKTGTIRVQANVRNAGKQAAKGRIAFSVSPAASGETLDVVQLQRDLPPDDTLIESALRVPGPRLWELHDPYMYRVTARVTVEGSESLDERSTRCGFRDFRLENGYFRLNGRRIYLKSSHTGADTPVGIRVAYDPDLLRRDLLNCKVMGFNMIRFIAGVPQRYQLELADEIGLMVYEENFAGWCLGDSPKMGERFDHSTLAMVRRDRNHPSVVVWGLLNETGPGAVFLRAVAALPKVRALDDTRVVMLNSGSFDGYAKGTKAGEGETRASIGRISNPGSGQWEDILSDQHPYQPLPHNAGVIHTLRSIGGGEPKYPRESPTISSDTLPLWLSEYGIGSALDLARLARHYEQLGKTHCEDAVGYRHFLDQFMADWRRWNMADTFANPEDYFRQCLAWMAGLRLLGINAIRANPSVIGYSLTGTQDQGLTGEGLTTTFRELKPGTIDALFNAFAPLRWCLFVEPVQVYRGRKAKLEAVLANEDALAPGEYPAQFQVVGPNGARVFDRTVKVTIPDPKRRPEPAFAMPVFAEEVVIDGPSGKYRFLATFQKGAAAAGGEAEFYVADPADMPRVETEVVLWGADAGLAAWLAANAVKTRPWAPGAQTAREVILAGDAAGNAEAFRELARHVARGSCAVFLSPGVFKKGDNPTGWLPLANKGTLAALPVWVYHKDDWARNHPIFEGTPAGGILDHTFFREVLPSTGWSGQDAPAEAVAGSINTSCGYSSGLLVAVYSLGAGRFILNTLRLRENLGRDPAAERLLRNMLKYAARDVAKPLADLPADFDQHLKAIGYER